MTDTDAAVAAAIELARKTVRAIAVDDAQVGRLPDPDIFAPHLREDYREAYGAEIARLAATTEAP